MFLLERGDRPENGIWGDRDGGRNGHVATFLLLYSSITFTVCVCGESKVPFITFQIFSILS